MLVRIEALAVRGRALVLIPWDPHSPIVVTSHRHLGTDDIAVAVSLCFCFLNIGLLLLVSKELTHIATE